MVPGTTKYSTEEVTPESEQEMLVDFRGQSHQLRGRSAAVTARKILRKCGLSFSRLPWKGCPNLTDLQEGKFRLRVFFLALALRSVSRPWPLETVISLLFAAFLSSATGNRGNLALKG